MGITFEEKFLLHIYEEAKAQGDLDESVNAGEMGRSLGYKERAIKKSIHLLTQGNFLKKIDDETVQLTENGKSLAKSLKGS